MLGKHQKPHMETQHNAYSQCCSRKELLRLSFQCRCLVQLLQKHQLMAQDSRTGEIGHGVTLLLVILMDVGMWQGWLGLAGLWKGEIFSQQSRGRNPIQPGCQWVLVKLSGPLSINLLFLMPFCCWGKRCVERLEELEIGRGRVASVCVLGMCQGVLALHFCGCAGVMPCACGCIYQAAFPAVGGFAARWEFSGDSVHQKSLAIKGN